MDKALNYVAIAIIAPFYWAHVTRRSLADRATSNYLRNVSEASVLSNFGNTLALLDQDTDHVDRIFGKFASRSADQNLVWSEKSFAHFVNAASGGMEENSISSLWQCFSRAAYFPLNPPYASHSSSQVVLDFFAFRRAFALLVLQGIQLIGFELYYGHHVPHNYQKKVPRIARFILTCATRRVVTQAFQLEKLEEGKDLTEENVLDVIVFTQPPGYQEPFSDKINTPGVLAGSFRDATQRLVSSAHSQPNYTTVYPEMRRDDLLALLQLLVLVCLQDRRWRNGFSLPPGSGRDDLVSADIQCSRLNLDDVSAAPKLARNLLAWYFHGEGDNISYSTFELFCSDSPTFVLLFFHLWASIFSVGSRPSKRGPPEIHSVMPLSVVNSLSILNVAKLDSCGPSKGRYFAKELQVNVDLQVSSLVLIDVDASRQTLTALKNALTAGPYFHIVLVQGQDTNKVQVLLAIFVSPRDPKMEILRAREGGRYSYTWRYSYVDLLPCISTTDAGPMSVEEGDESRGLVLVAHTGEQTDGGLPRIRLDIENRMLTNSARELRWTSLRCFRMPGTACQVTRYPSQMSGAGTG